MRALFVCFFHSDRVARFVRLAAPASVLFCIFFSTTVSARAAEDVRKVYAQWCASCHGERLEGGSGSNLLGQTWKHGGDDASLARVIRDGVAGTAMPGFGASFDDAQIRALVIFLREEGARAARRAGGEVTRPVPGGVAKSEVESFRMELVSDGLEVPWSIAFLPVSANGGGIRILVTERAGRLRLIEDGRLRPEPVAGTPRVWARGQGGLLAVGVHPDYAAAGNGWVYLSFSDPGEDGSAMTAVVRGRISEAGRWVDEEVIFRAPPSLYRKGGVHFGSRFVFEDGYLFFSIGERGQGSDAQDLTRPNGKVHRVLDDGRVPPDNPFLDTARFPGAVVRSIWSYGNRNPQGLAREPATGLLWEAEHGPRGGDELNVIRPGANYGWPVITHGMNYNGTPMTALTAKEGMEQPVWHWTPSIAVCAIAFYEGAMFPAWRGNLLVSSLASQDLRRLVIRDGRVTHEEVLFKGIGRVREVTVGPEGAVYLGLEEPGRVVRLVRP
ncbi:glucose sorbosone dehydrogenase [Opitutaceae bacterium TAV4]|nr:glucose sorbosone dehydrogenase [Opitutaceae bacterium TAV4]RRK01057.1 glucose sorbosone dehydrogenase [Opitutaceae bacterium TAV3]